ncbi:uncharacterized protein LOC129728377 [Wyeomyia smithii]|uniref:uncharacterized protein LOC129728377 n=1 Tax=Wyeomyia smithii TaxID=174621 RepID=UPI002467CFF8|nr:uncharacterized protein LOC129728377 [Wyeomyia smithii]
MKRESATELHSLIERFEANVRILKQLGEHTEHWDALRIHLLSARLDPVTKRDWEEHSEANKSTKFHQLTEFLQARVNVLQSVVSKSEPQSQTSFPKKYSGLRAGNHGAIQKGPRGCLACSGPHSLYQCERFPKMPIEAKENIVRSKQLCRNCLRQGHMARNCSSESTCRNCRGHHHTLICTSTSQQSFQGNVLHTTGSLSRPRNPSSQRNEEHVSSASAVQPGTTNSSIQEASRNKILLATAVILLVDGSGGEYPVRALLDSGSECSFITERATQRMSIRRERVSIAIAGIGQSSTRVLHKIRSTIKSGITDFATAIELLVLPKVTVDLPSMSVDVTSWSLPTRIQLADPSFYDPGSIDVVLGAEVFFDLFKASGRISLGDTLPTLVNSVFGWIVSGKVSEGAPRSAFVCNVASTADLHNDMERFWAIEDEPTTAYSPEEALCEKIFSETVTRDSDGRYVVRLPLKRDLLDNLGDNRRSALHRYRLIENRQGRDPGLATEYRKFMDEYFQLGHMERIDENNASS